MTEVDEFFRSAHDDLIYELEAHGFAQVDEAAWDGEVVASGNAWRVRIDFGQMYPVRAPKVFLLDEKPLSWHQESDGSLCLYSQSSPGAFPWFAHGALLDKVRGWLENDESGWADEIPDLDLERYWAPNARFSLVIHDELHQGGTNWVRFDRLAPNTLVQSGAAAPPHRRPKSHKHLYGLSVDIGEVKTPPRSWAQLSELIADSDRVEAELRERRADLLLIRYTRGGHSGVLGLVPLPGGASPELQLRSVSCASRSPETRALRAGYQSAELNQKVVTIVGVGAIGSFVADGLRRSGVRALVLVDGDRLRPGNLVRHAARESFVGRPKAEAMAATLGDLAEPLAGGVESLSFAGRLVEASDLVIDATANEVVTQLLTEAGRVAGKPILSVYLANAGRSKVVEILPPASGERLAPQEMAPIAPDGVESGCGDPVSPTPPFAVMEIAGMACRIATALLTDDEANARSEMREP
ncbi:ThiF family adenylyltransferase [Leifsonia sp. NPDC056665]|uniref:ThiF family adenylyltransferase n=1 Tax=Leifsonia sp. NPDC056665 TaxID=3345901 RepID=UPI0036BF999F